MAKFKKLEITYINGEPTFNFGGLVPRILFPDPSPQPQPSPTPTPSITPSPTSTYIPASPTPTPTSTYIPASPTPTPTNTGTPTPTPSSTYIPISPTPTPTYTPTPSPTPLPQGDFLLAETGDILTAENGDNIEYNYSIVPTDVLGLDKWWRSDVGITKYISGYVETWTDSESGEVATTNTSLGFYPTDVLNSLTGITMANDAEMTLVGTLTYPNFTAFAVYKVNNISSDGSYIIASNDDGIGGYIPTGIMGSPGLFIDNDGALAVGGVNSTSAQIGTWSKGDVNYEIRQNGSIVLTQSIGGGNDMTFSSLFNKPTASDGLLDGTLWELIIYDRELTNNEKLMVNLYLSTKYQITIN